MIQQFGVHKVRHGDVTKGIDDLMGADRAQIMYSDPPWGEGNIKFWATLNKKMNGHINVPAPLDVFLSSVFGIAAKYVDRYLLIEYGVRWRDMIQERGKAAGFTPRGIVDIQYRGGPKLLPLDLHVFTRGNQPIPTGWAEGVRMTHGYKTNQMAIGPLAKIVKEGYAGTPVILDPCCGMGYTAQAAVDYGMAFRGNELNRKRLDKTIGRISK